MQIEHRPFGTTADGTAVTGQDVAACIEAAPSPLKQAVKPRSSTTA